ncbi:MAG: 23S rRNA (adenine(2503)-C(2))-methyltransferase RlmN [Nitrospirae bacterium]|nr:23S rRNA (adenine(2503)-C(2))-methyltransferase RlmN [Nitrospirota bacterium]
MKKNFKGLTQDELTRFFEELGQKPYRCKQVLNWLYKKSAASFDEMTDLPADLREVLNRTAYISNLDLLQTQASSDGTLKFLFGLEDGESIESVLIPNVRGGNKFTLCISSQVGCALGCAFCATGRLGIRRSLRSYEIADQVTAVGRIVKSLSASPAGEGRKGLDPHKDDREISNIVFMGMGEPLNNFRNVVVALRIFTELMGFSKRKIAVSTAGVVPKIYELAEKAPEVNLAVSLNATTDEIRNKIMPVNRIYPLKDLMKACREYPLSPRRRITFEYVLFDGINDSEEDALRLIKLLRGIRSIVNLIPYNPSSPCLQNTLMLRTPSEKKILQFQSVLHKAGVIAIIRKSMGSDISAACGQLKAGYAVNSEQ